MSSTGTCICVMVIVSDSGITKVAGKMACVTRTWVSSSVMCRNAVSCMPHGLSTRLMSGLANSRMMRVIGHCSPSAVPAAALRNCLPAALLPMPSRASSCKKRCKYDGCAGSMPTSKACSQLAFHSPLKAKLWLDGALKQSNSGKGGGVVSSSPSHANSTPLFSITG